MMVEWCTMAKAIPFSHLTGFTVRSESGQVYLPSLAEYQSKGPEPGPLVAVQAAALPCTKVYFLKQFYHKEGTKEGT
jgi:hypothetical protein